MIDCIPCLPIATPKETLLAVFHLYLDESGKLGAGTDYTSLCGYVAHHDEWIRFTQEWDRYRFLWQIPPIHMSRIENPDRKEDGWKATKERLGAAWDDRRVLILRDFAGVIARSGLVGVGAVVDAAYFRKMPDWHIRNHTKDPNVFAFQDVLMTTIEKVEIVDRHSPIGIVIDNDEDSAFRYYDLLKDLKKHPDEGIFLKMRERIHSIAFVDDASYPGVQAADMLAYTARRHMVDRIGTVPEPVKDPNATFSMITAFGMHQPRMWDKNALEMIAKGNLEAYEQSQKVNGAE